MIKIPYDEMIAKIQEKSGLSKNEIDSKIDSKLQQLSGLISKEGAAHIVANELGIALVGQASGKMKIDDLKPGMRNVESLGKVLAVYEVREFTRDDRVGKVGSLFMGDESGRIRVVCWGNQADKLKNLAKGDILGVKGGYIKENNNFREMHVNDRSTLAINPEGETVGEVQEAPQATRKKISDLVGGENQVEVLGHVVQAFDPRFYEVCPQCGKRARNDDGSFKCPEHGVVTPDYAYVMNAVIDDGTENIRVVFFRKQVEDLVGKTEAEVKSYRTSPENFTPLKNGLLGNMIKIQGRVVHNEMFDRTEMIAQSVDTKPDPDEEIKRIEDL